MAKTILIVDDEPGTVAVVKRQLEERGYAVCTADDGEQALEFLKTRPPDFAQNRQPVFKNAHYPG